ncbi:MAG: hypothetical protein ACK4GL_07080 [Flavobacteriales bacterium]
MKKILFLTTITLLLFNACSRENTYKKRISKTWKMEEYRVNGDNKTTDFNTVFQNYSITFTESGTFSENWVTIIPLVNSGNYEFFNNANNVELRDVNQTRRFKINTINKSRLDVEYTHTNNDNSTELRRYILKQV